MKRMITISLGLAVFAAGAVPALGQFDCEFFTSSGDWSDPLNWRFCDDGIPGSDDTATILIDQTCKVEDSHHDVGGITVNSGGTLAVIGKVLGLYGDGTIEGTVSLKSNGTVRVSALAVTLDGEGIITARQPDYGQGTIYGMYSATVLTIGEDLTIAGDVAVVIHLVNNGTFVCDGDDDTFLLAGPGLDGTGTFDVSAGLMSMGNYDEIVGSSSLTWILSGGELEIGTPCDECSDFSGSFEVSGGTLDVNVDLCTEKTMTFSGGTIDVAASTSAHFSAASCP